MLVALYENDTPFKPHLVDLGDPAASAALKAIWPIGKFPVLRDEGPGRTIPEASIIIEYLDLHHPGRTRLVPSDPDMATQMRLWDRFFDLYVNVPMQKIVTDRLRPAGRTDAFGVEQARDQLRIAYGILEKEIDGKAWIMGDAFTMADCAAAPSLFYANLTLPLGDAFKNAAGYLDRLMQRPSYARALAEAQPYLHLVPRGD